MISRKVLSVFLVLVSILIVVITACTQKPAPAPTPKPTPAPQPAAEKKIVWKGQTAYVGSSNWNVEMFTDTVNNMFKGRFEIQYLPPGSVVPDAQLFDAVSKGTLDIARTFLGAARGKIPESDILAGLPMAFDSVEEAYDAFYTRGLIDTTQKLFEKENLHIQPGFINIYGRNIMGKAPAIRSVADLKGRKLRVVGSEGELFRRLGASPANIPAAEMYMGLKLGTIDGVLYAPVGLEDWKLKEVVNFVIVEPKTSIPTNAEIINLNSWKALPADIREALEKYLATRTMLEYSMRINNEDRKIAFKAQSEFGIEVVRFSAADIQKMRETAMEIWDNLAKISPDAARMIDVIKQQQRDFGKIAKK